MQIHGINKLTLLDYPEKTACTVFTGGCNFRCPFCHNASLALDPSKEPIIDEKELFALLAKRKGILDGVAITGGEPTLNKDLPEFIKKIKDFGFLVKLDTNGANPAMLKTLLYNNLIDYVAMDIKNSYANYDKAIGLKNYDLSKIKESVEIIKQLKHHEFRTTVVREIHTLEDFYAIGEEFKTEKFYYLQQFKDSGNLIDNTLTAATEDEMREYKAVLSKYIPNVIARGIDL